MTRRDDELLRASTARRVGGISGHSAGGTSSDVSIGWPGGWCVGLEAGWLFKFTVVADDDPDEIVDYEGRIFRNEEGYSDLSELFRRNLFNLWIRGADVVQFDADAPLYAELEEAPSW
jgi:hypothetical protein